jgi:hypothetical protein
MAAPLFTNRMVAVNPDRTWSFESLQRLQSLVSLAGGDTGNIPATRITVSPTGSLSSTDGQAAFAELEAEKASTGSVTAAQAFAIQRANHTGTQTAATISDFSTAADARADLRVAAAVGVSVQAYDADLTTWGGKTAPAGVVVGTTDAQTLTNKALTSPDIDGGTVDNAPIGATTPNTGKFTSVESTGYVKTASTTFASLPAAATAGAGARHFITDCNSTTFLAAAAAGGANKVPVVSDGAQWLIG